MTDPLITPSANVKTPILKRADIALWRLPRPLRKLIVAPVAVAVAVEEFWNGGAHDARQGWRSIMNHVEERPMPVENEVVRGA